MHQSTQADNWSSRALWRLSLTRSEAGSPEYYSPREAHADVCIVGAGIAGMTTALLCVQQGLRVIVLEGGTVGSGETLRTSGHLTNVLDERFVELEVRFGGDDARLLAESHAFAIDFIERFCAEHAPDAQFQRVPGFLYADPKSDDGPGILQLECRAAMRAGLHASMVEVPEFGVGVTHFAVRFENQAEFDPGRYLSALAQTFLDRGGILWEHQMVTGIDEGDPHKVLLEGDEPVLARSVVVATNAPISSAMSLPLKQAAYRSYVLAFEVPVNWMEPSLHWDMADPYHYVRLARSGDLAESHALLLVGGEDHRTGQDDPEKRLASLESWARDRFRLEGRIAQSWSGQILEPFDGVGLVGRSPGSERVFVISGDSGHGLTLGTLGAHLVLDAINDTPNRWSRLFAPERAVTKGVLQFLGENANSVGAYLDHFKPAEFEFVEQLEPGQGGLFRDKHRLLAIGRDRSGVCHVRSALCPHLGAIVHFNAVEQTWDCPAHGSRFDLQGQVISGPAVDGLAVAELPRKVKRKAS